MRVLMVTNMYPSSERPAWGVFVKSQVDSVIRCGVETDVLVIDGYRSRLNYLRAVSDLRRRCRAQRYDLIHAHYGFCGLVARMQRRVPVLVSFCGDDLLGTPDRRGRPTVLSRALAWVHRRLSGCVEGVIVKSEAMRRLLPPARATVIPNGVNLDLFRPLDPVDCRRALGLRDDGVFVLFPYSPATIRKNYPLVEAAVARLNAGGEPRMEILVVDNEPQERLPLYLNASDVVVMPSLWEGSPNIVKEAMACNTRVVATDVGDVREVMAGVEGCRICAPTVADVAAAIRSVLKTPRKTKGRDAVAHLAIERVADRVVREYVAVLARAGVGARE